MTGHIGVHSVESLKQFKTAMVRFQADAAAALEQAEGVLRETIAHLQELRRSAGQTKCGRVRMKWRKPNRICVNVNRPEMTTSARIAGNSGTRYGGPSGGCRRAGTTCVLRKDRSARLSRPRRSIARKARKLRQQLTQDWVKARSRLEAEIMHLQSYVSGPPVDEIGPQESA